MVGVEVGGHEDIHACGLWCHLMTVKIKSREIMEVCKQRLGGDTNKLRSKNNSELHNEVLVVVTLLTKIENLS